MTDKSLIVKEAKDKLSSILKLLEELDTEDVDQSSHRVIHLRNNPHQMEMKARERELAFQKRENERLKVRLELLEAGADVTRHIGDADQIETLTKKVSELQRREEKLLHSFGKTSREFREVCYLLTGYRVDALRDNIYRLSSMYAESEDDKLLFEVSPDGTIQLLKNEYSETLSEYIHTYLENADSFPAFLSSITLDLFKSTTQISPMSMCMSMCMSTTVQPNPNYKPRRN